MRSFTKRVTAIGAVALCLGCAMGSDAAADRESSGSKSEEEKNAIVLASGDDSEVVSSRVYLAHDKLVAGKKSRFAVVIDVDKGWHINANPAKPDFLVPTALAVKSKLGTDLAGVKYPEGKGLMIGGLGEPIMSYSGRVVIFGDLEVPASAAGKEETVAIAVRYQACDDSQCLRPDIKTLTGKIPVAASRDGVKPVNDWLFRPQAAKESRKN